MGGNVHVGGNYALVGEELLGEPTYIHVLLLVSSRYSLYESHEWHMKFICMVMIAVFGVADK